MNGVALTRESPFVRRLAAYLNERFPLLGYGVLIVSYTSSNQFLAHALVHPGEAMRYSLNSLIAAVTLFCFFFHLRVFDEHKDFEDDTRLHPQRVLQRGLIGLRHLKFLGVAAIALEIVLVSIRGLPALVSWSLAFGFSVLMLKEFFVAKWLKRHFLVYATSHMLIMPLLAAVVFSIATGLHAWEAPGWFIVYSWVGFFVTFNWEISRKIRAPEEEREGVETYTRILGTYGAAYAVLIIRVIDTGLVALVGSHLGLSWIFHASLVALFFICMIGFIQYRFWTNPRTARRMEAYAGMYIIAFDLLLAAELVHKNGLGLKTS